MVTVLDNL